MGFCFYLVPVAGLQQLASFPASLSPLSRDQLQEVLSFLREVLLSGDDDSLQTEVLNALVNISDSEDRFRGVESSSVSTGILTEVIPYLLQAVAEEGTETVQLVEKQLIALQMIGGSRPIARKIVIEGLLTTVSQDLTQQYTNDGNGEWICGKVASVLHCLSNDILPRCDSSSDTDQASAAKVALEIWTFFHSSQPWVRANEQILRWSMEAMRVAVQKCNITTQKKILQKGSEILFSCRSEDTQCTTDSSVQEGMEKVVETAKSQAACVDERGWVIGHLAAVVVSLIPSTDICNERVLLEEFVGVAIHGQSPLLTEVAAQAVASMLNKWVIAAKDKEALHLHLEDMIHLALDKGWFAELPQKKKQSTNEGSVPNDTKDVSGDHVQRRVRAICAIAWAGKGLAMRGHSRVADVASLLITLLLSGTVAEDREEDGSVRMAAAQGFSIIVEDSPVCLNKAHHAVIRPLFKQRFFHSMLTPLMEAMQKASAADVELSRLWLYRGLAHLVSGIPHSVVLTDGEKVSIHHIYPSLLFCVLLVYGLFNFNPICHNFFSGWKGVRWKLF
jgi:DNA repair/transcription protein MET18/MMS19